MLKGKYFNQIKLHHLINPADCDYVTTPAIRRSCGEQVWRSWVRFQPCYRSQDLSGPHLYQVLGRLLPCTLSNQQLMNRVKVMISYG